MFLFTNIYVTIYFWLYWVLVMTLGSLVAACGILFPDQGLNPGPLLWECDILAPGP